MASNKIYIATFDRVAVTAVQDLFELVAPSDASVIIHECRIGQSLDAGDAQDEMLAIRMVEGYTTSGSGGSSVTPAPNSKDDVAFGGTCEANNTTVANTGTTTLCDADSFNVRSGWVFKPVPEDRLTLAPSSRLVVHLPVAPTDSLTMSGTLIFEEIS